VADRTFTPSEANSALERVRPIAERMVAAAAGLSSRSEERPRAAVGAAGNGSSEAVRPADGPDRALLGELEGCVSELRRLGVEVKDLESGLVDFPSVRDGEEVLLCWRVGEPAVEWWHRREEGFAGRRRIDGGLP
jgi:hypothetical protein